MKHFRVDVVTEDHEDGSSTVTAEVTAGPAGLLRQVVRRVIRVDQQERPRVADQIRVTAMNEAVWHYLLGRPQ